VPRVPVLVDVPDRVEGTLAAEIALLDRELRRMIPYPTPV